MGKFKEVAKFEKEHMPEYQYKFLYHGVMPGLIFVLGGAFVCAGFVVLGAVFDIMLLGLIPLCIWVAGTFTLLALLLIKGKKISKRLIDDRAEELERNFAPIDYEKAKEKLAKENIISDGKLILENDDDPSAACDSIALEDCIIMFFCFTRSGAFYYRLEFDRKSDGRGLEIMDIDKNIYTYFAQNSHLIMNNKLFRLFVEDKKEFMRLLLKYNDASKMEAKMEKVN